MNENSSVIISLCSHICSEGCSPFTSSEWSKFAIRLVEKKLQPKDIVDFSDDDYKKQLSYNSDEITRIRKLFDRSGSLSFEIEKYAGMGIKIVTRADVEYPRILKDKLKDSRPPLFYYAGDLNLVNREYVGFVGSRTINEDDMMFSKNAVSKIFKHGFGVVSGGAKGIDSVSTESMLSLGGFCIEYLSDSLLRKIKRHDVVSHIQNGNLLLVSIANPDAGFNTGIAMQRNKFIYSQSNGTVVVRSDYNKGGTWSGATEALKKKYCTVFCRQNDSSQGNKELIRLGAVPINENWDGEIVEAQVECEKVEQLSLFEEFA